MRIYFDENFSPRLVAGIREFQNGRPCEDIAVHSVVEDFGRGTPDEQWIPEIASRKGVIITQDLNLHRTQAQWRICQLSPIGIFFLRPPKGGWSYWQVIDLVLKHWSEIKTIAHRERRPFGYCFDHRTRAGKMRRL